MTNLKMIGLALALAFGSAVTGQANAQPFPAKPIRIVVPFGPGGFADITMRLVGQKLSERIGQQVVIENRPSAGGIVAGNAVTSAPADGYTLFVMASGIALSKSLIKSMPFDPVTAFEPISTIALFDNLVLVRKDSKLKTIADFVAAARANPDKFNVATTNPGSTQHVVAELIRYAAKAPLTIVPHRTTGEVLTTLLRGDTQAAIESYAALKSPIDSGAIRAIGGTGSKRSPMQPNVPTFKENGIDAVCDGWNSLVAPAGTPKPVVAVLAQNIKAVVESKEFSSRMIELGGEPHASTPEELHQRLVSDIAMWAALIKKAGIQPL